MKNYAKIILYAYPLLETVEKDYEEHIGNKAILSYDGRWTAEQMAEYLAGEILEMRRLEWLKNTVRERLERLSEEERTLIAIRYFGKRKDLKKLLDKKGKGWTERSYFRRQAKLLGKLKEAFALAGITEDVYVREFSDMDIFKRVEKAVEKMKLSRKRQ